MTNDTNYISICIAGDPTELALMDAQMAEALTIPDSGNERWAGNLWLHMDIDPCDTDVANATITGHEARSRLLYVEAESRGVPRLKAIDDFMKRYAPSGKMLIFVTDPHENTAFTTGGDGAYASVLFTCEKGSNNPKARELDDWTTIWEQCNLLTAMALKLDMDESAGFDAVSKAFMEQYPVLILPYAHKDIGNYLK